MPSIVERCMRATARTLAGALVGCAALGTAAGVAGAQTYGFATLQPGTLNHTTASAVAKVLKEKAGLNVLVQPTAGDQVIVPMVDRGEAEIGISNAMEVHDGLAKGFKELRIIAAAHALRVGFFVRKDGGIRTVAELKGKRVPYGFSAMRALEPTVRAILATASLSEKDIKPVLVPNVIRSADDFASGAADAFYFAFGAPKVREVDVTVGGIRMTEIDERGMPAARKIERWGYLTEIGPGPVFVGVERPMKVYSFDNLIFTSAKTSDEFVFKVLDTLFNNKDELIAVQPVLREFTPPFAYKQYDVAYHPGAVKYFKEHNVAPKAVD
jgi:TRAP transporter TAXI family solute receptor